MIIYLERKKRLFKKNMYLFKFYNNITNNYTNIDLDNIIINKNYYNINLENGIINIYKKNNKIMINIKTNEIITYIQGTNIIKTQNFRNNFNLLYKFKINKLGDCGFLKSNKNTIISYNELPLFKIGKINSNQFKIIINTFNLCNINYYIDNHYIYITIIISLLLFN